MKTSTHFVELWSGTDQTFGSYKSCCLASVQLAEWTWVQINLSEGHHFPQIAHCQTWPYKILRNNNGFCKEFLYWMSETGSVKITYFVTKWIIIFLLLRNFLIQLTKWRILFGSVGIFFIKIVFWMTVRNRLCDKSLDLWPK